jgi:hypothetical protein
VPQSSSVMPKLFLIGVIALNLAFALFVLRAGG